jgi:hypothetical protein
MIRPDNPMRIRWTIFVLLLVVFCAIEIPLELIFHLDQQQSFMWIDLLISLAFLTDVVLNFSTAVDEKGRRITDRKEVAKHYLKGWFAIDFVSSIPFEILFLFFDVERLAIFSVLRMLRSLRLIRLLKVGSTILRYNRRSSLNPIVLRMGFILFWVALASHWAACFWIHLGGVRDDVPTLEDNPTVACYDGPALDRLHSEFPEIEAQLDGFGETGEGGAICYDTADLDERRLGDDAVAALRGRAAGSVRTYFRSLYFVITTWATVGFGDISAKTLPQTIFAILLEILGAGTFGYLVGNVASLLANLDVTKVQRQEKLARLSSFTRRHKLPDDLQRRIFDYYHYLWERGRDAEEIEVVADLPGGLRTDVYLHLNRDIVENVPLFRGADEALIRRVVEKLEPAVFTPGEHVFRRGDAGDKMYFITSGAVEVFGDDERDVLANLGPGSYFGEMALLSSEPRNASVKAREHCDMYTLPKAAFEELLTNHPEIADKVRALASERASAGPEEG